MPTFRKEFIERKRVIKLAWDANAAGDNVTHYQLYYGSATGTYNGSTSPVNMGNVTTYTYDPPVKITGPTYFAITAVNVTGESGFSSEVNEVI